MRLSLSLALLASTASFPTSLLCQQQSVTPMHGVVHATRVAPQDLDVPQPPRAILQTPPKHGGPVIPIGSGGNPQPTDGPIAIASADVDVAGDFAAWRNTVVKPAGASSSRISEPACVFADPNNGFFTANWYAARSADGGASWSYENPYTKFPSRWGGFCCDQRLVNSGATTVWYMQYVADGSGNGGARLAVSTSAANLGAGSFAHYYDFAPTNFGFPAGTWLDFPDCAASNGSFFFASNVFNAASQYQGAVVWRLGVSDIASGGSIGYSYITSATIGGGSYRLTQDATTRMHWAYHRSTTQLRVLWWDDAGGNIFWNDRPVAQWSSSYAAAPGPDGRDWTGRADSRIGGAYHHDNFYGWVWHSGPVGGQTNNHLRLVKYDANTDALLEERILWNNAISVMYPAAAANRLGHVAVTSALGGGAYYPQPQCIIQDEVSNFGVFQLMAGVNSGPTSNVWGDYFTMQRQRNFTQEMQWVGTGMAMVGGGANGNQEPRMYRFGRSAFETGFTGLVVRSSPSMGAAITVGPADRFGESNGNTPFFRSYANNQGGISVTAPSTFGGRLFHRWAYNTVPSYSYAYQPVGQLTYTISSIGVQTDVVEAQYVDARTLTVQSTNPTSGVSITVSPADFNGAGNGTTTFSRTYRDGDVVSLTAPTASGFNPFKQWRLDGVAQPLGNRVLSVTMTGNRTAIADYYTNVAGALTTIGTGCVGSNGQIPVHSATWGAGQQGPQQGLPMTYRLANARPFAGCALNFGLSTTNWGPFALPLNLGFVGIPGCFFYHDYVVSVSTTTDAAGAASFPVTWPVDPAAIGGWVYTSFNIIDPGNGRPTPLTYSNALGTRQGGNI